MSASAAKRAARTATVSQTTALSAHDLSCGYTQAHPVLAGLNLQVPQGRLVCIIGPNGVGKSTLARSLAGLLSPLAGEVRLHGRPLGDFTPSERAREVSVVLTRLPATGYLTVRDFVEIGRHPYTGALGRVTASDREAVDRAIRQVGMRGLESRSLNAISDGERQRAAIARAFAQAATLMILDEPTAFLDVESRAVVMTTLRDVAHGTGRTVIATSHDIELVLRIADEIWMITPDKVILSGAPEDLVLDGALGEVFPNHVLQFDPETGAFRLPLNSGEVAVVAGSGPRALWTARALERIGLRAVAEGGPDWDSDTTSAAMRVVVTPGTDPDTADGRQPAQPADGRWVIRAGDQERSFNSIATLVEHLRHR